MAASHLPFQDPQVAAAFAAFPDAERADLLLLRDLIFDVAARTPGVGRIKETLKWGQPAYLTPESKSGTSLRLGMPKTGGFALYVHCQTSLIPNFCALSPGELAYEGNRAIRFETGTDTSDTPITLLIANALTYHL